MKRGRDEAGNIWELDANGNPVRMLQPAQAAGGIPGSLSIPPDPAKVAQQQREQARQDAADARANTSLHLAEAANKRAQQKFDSEDTMAPPPGDTSKTGDDYLKTLPPSLAAQVKAMAEGRRAFPTGTALRSPAIQQLIAAATQYDPTLDAANAATRVATRKDFTSGKSAQNITALNTALGHLGQLWEDAQALHNRGLVPWNALANAVESTGGDPRLNNFNLARKAVADELERVFRQAGGNVSEINEWKGTLSSSSSPEQFRGAMSQAVGLLNSRLEALGAQYNQGMSRSDQPISLLKPHAQAVFTALQDGGSGIIPNQGGPTAPPAIGGGTPPPVGPSGGPSADYSRMVGGPEQSLATMDPNSKLGALKQTYRNEYDPVAAKTLSAFIRHGEPYETASAFATSHGFMPPDPKAYAEAVTFAKAHGGATNVNATRSVPTTFGERVVSSPGAAGVAGGLSAATAGLDDTAGRLIAGSDYDANRRALADLHPTADLVGNVVGGIGGALAAPAMAAKIPGALALGAKVSGALGKFAPAAGDAAFSSLYGANENPDDPVMGALTGAITGIGGGVAGRAGARGLANVIAPPAGAFAPVYAQGIFPTIGQRFAKSGFPGRAINTAEQAMQSVPGVGAMVARARDIPRDAAQLGAFNQSLSELKPFDTVLGETVSSLPPGMQPGTDPHQFAQQAFGKAYPIARAGMRVVPGEDYTAATRAFADKWMPLLNTEQKQQLGGIIKSSVTDRIKAGGGVMDGAAYQQAASDIGNAAHAWGRSEPLLGQAASEFGGILDGAARASSDPAAVALLDAADRGYAKYAVVRNAGARVGGDPGTFTMKNLQRAVQQEGGGVASGPFQRGQALMQDYSTAVQPLGDTIANSGTGERLLTNRAFLREQAGAGSLAAVTPIGRAMLAHPGALAPFLPYAPGINALVTRAIAPRSATLTPVMAQFLEQQAARTRQLAPFVGRAAVPGALAYFGGDQ